MLTPKCHGTQYHTTKKFILLFNIHRPRVCDNEKLFFTLKSLKRQPIIHGFSNNPRYLDLIMCSPNPTCNTISNQQNVSNRSPSSSPRKEEHRPGSSPSHRVGLCVGQRKSELDTYSGRRSHFRRQRLGHGMRHRERLIRTGGNCHPFIRLWTCFGCIRR